MIGWDRKGEREGEEGEGDKISGKGTEGLVTECSVEGGVRVE